MNGIDADMLIPEVENRSVKEVDQETGIRRTVSSEQERTTFCSPKRNMPSRAYHIACSHLQLWTLQTSCMIHRAHEGRHRRRFC